MLVILRFNGEVSISQRAFARELFCSRQIDTGIRDEQRSRLARKKFFPPFPRGWKKKEEEARGIALKARADKHRAERIASD